MTINALAILNEEGEALIEHFRDQVIGGPGSFVMSCADYGDFAAAIRRKLLREVTGEAATA